MPLENPLFSPSFGLVIEAKKNNNLAVLNSSQSEWWAELDSNQRRRKPADLQSAPFGHFGIYPLLRGRPNLRGAFTSGKRVLHTFTAHISGSSSKMVGIRP